MKNKMNKLWIRIVVNHHLNNQVFQDNHPRVYVLYVLTKKKLYLAFLTRRLGK